MSGSKPTSMKQYLAGLPADQRNVLQKLRQTIQAAAPEAVEGWSYSMPAFKLNGRTLVCFSAFKNHCSFFPMSGKLVAEHQQELRGFETSKGTIRFTSKKPLPAALVRKLVLERLKQVQSRGAKPKQASAPVVEKLRGSKASLKGKRSAKTNLVQTSRAVEAFLRALDHPLKKDIERARKIILSISPDIREGIKWNAPSFRTKDDFATFFLRPKHAVQIIFHLGAKRRDPPKVPQLADPDGLVQWLATDRCLVTLGTGKEIQQKRAALQAIVREWMAWL
jgi:uncharacterized protein YdhG (YjbR/CyaY superfamily)